MWVTYNLLRAIYDCFLIDALLDDVQDGEQEAYEGEADEEGVRLLALHEACEELLPRVEAAVDGALVRLLRVLDAHCCAALLLLQLPAGTLVLRQEESSLLSRRFSRQIYRPFPLL